MNWGKPNGSVTVTIDVDGTFLEVTEVNHMIVKDKKSKQCLHNIWVFSTLGEASIDWGIRVFKNGQLLSGAPKQILPFVHFETHKVPGDIYVTNMGAACHTQNLWWQWW